MLRHKNVKFAFRKETPVIRSTIPHNLFEKIGHILSWLVYGFGEFFIKQVSDPRFITIVFTLFAMTFTAFIFYPLTSSLYFFRALRWFIDHINWEFLRLVLWIFTEVTIFGLGIRALGRFSNRKLMEHYGILQKS